MWIFSKKALDISQKDDITCLGRDIPYLDYTNKSFSSSFASSFASINIENIIDWQATYNANSIAKFIEFNKFSKFFGLSTFSSLCALTTKYSLSFWFNCFNNC